MTDKQIIIEDYFNIMRDDYGRIYGIQEIGDPKQLIRAIKEQNEYIQTKEQECSEYSKKLARFQQEVVPKLRERLRNKEQECERLKHDNEYEVGALEKTINNLKVELEQEKALKETYLACYKTKHKELADKYEALKARCKSLEDISGRLQKQNHELTLENEKLEQYKASKQASYEVLQKKCNELELENRKLRGD